MSKYTLHAYLPDGQLMVVRSMVDREEAEDMAAVLCRVIEELERAEDFPNAAPRRVGDTWYVCSKKSQRNGSLLCWLERHEGKMLDHFQRYETNTTNPQVGKAIQYELRRNPSVLATAYVEGVHWGRATLPTDVWELVVKNDEFLKDKYGLSPEEIGELRGLWDDFQGVVKTSEASLNEGSK